MRLIPEPDPFAETLDIVQGFVDLADHRGDGPVQGLRRRLHTLRQAPRPPRTTREVEQAAVTIEHTLWLAVVSDLLVPPLRARVAAALGVDHPDDEDLGADDLWALIDPDVREAHDRACEAARIKTTRSVVHGCRRYAATRDARHLGRAVAELESAGRDERERLAVRQSPTGSAHEADRLERALREVLPPAAFRFLATTVRDAIEAEFSVLRSSGAARSRTPEQCLSHASWTGGGWEQAPSTGRWFVGWFQEQFEDDQQQRRTAAQARQHAQKVAEQARARTVRDEEARRQRAEQEAVERALHARPQDVDGPVEQGDLFVESSIQRIPDYDPSYCVAWPDQIEASERYIEEKAAKNVAEAEEYARAVAEQAQKEAERLRAEAEAAQPNERWAAKMARNASPSWAQSRW